MDMAILGTFTASESSFFSHLAYFCGGGCTVLSWMSNDRPNGQVSAAVAPTLSEDLPCLFQFLELASVPCLSE